MSRSSLIVFFLATGLTLVSAGQIERIDKFEGDECPLKNGGTGTCRKTIECINGPAILRQERHCEFSGNNPVICCPKADFTVQTGRVVQDKCSKVSPHSGPKLADHVVGKTFKAQVGEFPFIGLLVYEEEENARCGASMISSKFLLTATHCFRYKPTTVRMGTITATDLLADTYVVAKTHRHSEYNRYVKQNDIGLVELRDEVQMNANVQPICLYTGLVDLPSATELTVIGWGINDTNRNELSNDLLRGAVKPVTRSSCQSHYPAKVKITEMQLCALGEKDSKGEHTDACGGDSGGPLVMRKDGKYHLVGVVSLGAGCGSGVPGVYTRVASYLQWVSERVWNV